MSVAYVCIQFSSQSLFLCHCALHQATMTAEHFFYCGQVSLQNRQKEISKSVEMDWRHVMLLRMAVDNWIMCWFLDFSKQSKDFQHLNLKSSPYCRSYSVATRACAKPEYRKKNHKINKLYIYLSYKVNFHSNNFDLINVMQTMKDVFVYAWKQTNFHAHSINSAPKLIVKGKLEMTSSLVHMQLCQDSIRSILRQFINYKHK